MQSSQDFGLSTSRASGEPRDVKAAVSAIREFARIALSEASRPNGDMGEARRCMQMIATWSEWCAERLDS